MGYAWQHPRTPARASGYFETTLNNNYMMETGMELIAQERCEQLEKHRISVTYDAAVNDSNQLVRAAMLLSLQGQVCNNCVNELSPVGWDLARWRKMMNKSYKERLIIAGALIAAEIDRLNYSESKEGR